jgi:hypothetical protein
MSDIGKIQFIKGDLRYKGAEDVGINISVPLVNTQKEIDEYNRTININLADLYYKERQQSSVYIPTAKFSFIFDNSYSGLALTQSLPYAPFNNNLYYVNEEFYRASSTNENGEPLNIPWAGFPRYDEFTFIRTDNNITGYTTGTDPHVNFKNSDSSYYNWFIQTSYVFSSKTDVDMMYITTNGDVQQNLSFKSGDGIPYTMTYVQIQGSNYWQLRCPIPHGLNIDEYVELDFSYNGTNLFQVDLLGDGSFNSELFVFNILDINYITNGQGNFYEGKYSTFKRVLFNDLSGETKSEYYVRVHKILTKYDETNITNAGFEYNAFRDVKKYYSAALTPNNQSRIAVKEGSRSYNVSLKNPVSLLGLIDNNNRPVTELFFTVFNRGYFGWFNPVINGLEGVANSPSLRQGWEFNIGENSASWWLNLQSLSNIKTNQYNKGSQTFRYNQPFNVGDLVLGDFCEWNDYEQTERVISEYYHKFEFNQNNFSIGINKGYYYKPHNKFTLRVFSDYLEEGILGQIANVPDYAYFSEASNSFIWRDLYDFGFIDTDGLGVDYPFLNGRHYPYENFIFRIIPEGTNEGPLSGSIQDPITDACE